MAEKNFKFGKGYKPMDPRIPINPKLQNSKENYTKTYIIKLVKTSDKKKILKEARGKQACYIQRNKDKGDNIFLIENKASKKTVEPLSSIMKVKRKLSN